MAGFSETRLRYLAAAGVAAAVLTVCTPLAGADPNALWTIVDGQCAPGQRLDHNPAPCAAVDLHGGYVVLKDRVGDTQFLLIPTARVAGIESPEILAPDSPNYVADAWRARSFVEQRAGRALPRDWMSLAVNSAAARSQNQLHIHIDCVRADVRQALSAHVGEIAPSWQPFPATLAGRHYRAMAVWDPDLDSVNAFRVLADGLPAGAEMGAQTLVVVGITGADGRVGFALLAGRAEPADPDSGHGEDLQDHASCPPPAEVLGK